MKKFLIVLAILAVLAGAVCAYWFGYQWYLEKGWEAAAERIEANHPLIDVAGVEYFTGKQLNIYIEPLARLMDIEKKTYTPYVMIAIQLVGDEVPGDEETMALFNDIRLEAKRIAGKNTKVMVFVIDDAGGYYVANCYVELHSAVAIKSRDQIVINPLWWRTFPAEMVNFPGRTGD